MDLLTRIGIYVPVAMLILKALDDGINKRNFTAVYEDLFGAGGILAVVRMLHTNTNKTEATAVKVAAIEDKVAAVDHKTTQINAKV